MSEDRRLPSKETGRKLTDALRRALAAGRRGRHVENVVAGPLAASPPVDSDEALEDWTAERFLRHVMGPELESRELGPFIRPDGSPSPLGGATHILRFPEWLARWLAGLTPEKVAHLDTLMGLGPEGVRALQEHARRELERKIIRKARRGTRKMVIGAVIASFVAAKWFADQVGWIVEKFPLAQAAWTWLRGSGS